MLPDENGQAPLVQHCRKPLSQKQQVSLHQPDRNGVADGFQHAHSNGLRDGLLAAALLLFCLERGVSVVALTLPLGVVDRAFGIGAYLLGFALLRAFSDDRLGSVLAGLVFGQVALIFTLRLVVHDFDVPIARNDRATFGGFAVGGADLYQLRFCGDGLLYVCVDLGSVTFRIAARIGMVGSHVFSSLALRERTGTRR